MKTILITFLAILSFSHISAAENYSITEFKRDPVKCYCNDSGKTNFLVDKSKLSARSHSTPYPIVSETVKRYRIDLPDGLQDNARQACPPSNASGLVACWLRIAHVKSNKPRSGKKTTLKNRQADCLAQGATLGAQRCKD